jgi:hypothetical protein
VTTLAGDGTATGNLLDGSGNPISTPAPFLASLQSPVTASSYLFPGVTVLNRRLSAVSLTPNATYPCVLTVANLPTLPTAGNAFPIVSPTYTLGYTQNPSVSENNAFRGVYNFVLANKAFPLDGANDQIAGGLSFSVLNNNSASPFTATNALRGQARACVNGAPAITGVVSTAPAASITLRTNGYIANQGIYSGIQSATINGSAVAVTPVAAPNDNTQVTVDTTSFATGTPLSIVLRVDRGAGSLGNTAAFSTTAP